MLGEICTERAIKCGVMRKNKNDDVEFVVL